LADVKKACLLRHVIGIKYWTSFLFLVLVKSMKHLEACPASAPGKNIMKLHIWVHRLNLGLVIKSIHWMKYNL